MSDHGDRARAELRNAAQLYPNEDASGYSRACAMWALEFAQVHAVLALAGDDGAEDRKTAMQHLQDADRISRERGYDHPRAEYHLRAALVHATLAASGGR